MEKIFFTKAYNLFKENKYDSAIENLNLGLIHNKNYYYIYLLFGMIYMKQNKFEAARENYETCINIDPKKEDALLKLSLYYRMKNDNKNEYKYIKQSIDNNPNSYNSLLSFGTISIERRDYDKAIDTFLKAKQLFPAKKEIMLGLARTYDEKGMRKECDDIIDNLIKEDARNASYYELKSLVLKNRFKYSEAMEQIDIAIALDPHNEKIKSKKIILEYYLEHYDIVIKEGILLIERNGDSSLILFSLYFYIASAYRNKGDIELFIDFMRIYESKGKKGEEYYYEYAVYYYFNKKDIEEAKVYLQKSLDCYKDFIPSIELKIIILENDGQYNEANKLKERYKNELKEYRNRIIEKKVVDSIQSIQIKDIDFSQMSNMTSNMISKQKSRLIQNNSIKNSSYNSKQNLSSGNLSQDSSVTLLGVGGFGKVYLKNVDGEDLAVKQINFPNNISETKKQQIIDLIQSEIKATLGLKHPNIILQKGFLNSKIYMEYASGKDLRNLLSKTTLNIKFKIYLIKEIAHGLCYLHSKNIIHGDLKCLNILLSKPYNEKEIEYPIPKICDFGLCITMDDTSQLKGYTLRWGAPEVILKKKATKKSDIFSFGMVMYEIISQKIPFYEIKDNNIITQMIINKKIPNIDILDCKENIKQIIKNTLNYDENIRPTTDKLSEELDTIYNKEYK